jgi:hypothetical protein
MADRPLAVDPQLLARVAEQRNAVARVADVKRRIEQLLDAEESKLRALDRELKSAVEASVCAHQVAERKRADPFGGAGPSPVV